MAEVGPDWVRLDGPESGEWVPTSTFVWTAGVAPDPLAGKLGLPTDERGRIVVDETLAVPGRPEVFALGDAAAVPIAGQHGAVTPPTAQHALRQAWACGDNVAASLGHGKPRPFRFKGLGLLVNLSEHYALTTWLRCRPGAGGCASASTGWSPSSSLVTSPSLAPSATRSPCRASTARPEVLHKGDASG